MEKPIPAPSLAVPQTDTRHRNVALDVIRALAILMVMFNHLFIIDSQNITHGYFHWITAFFNVLETGGWSGVDLFFVLSGFLVSGLLFNEYKKTGTVTPVRFLIRRGFKIYPSFTFMILVTLIVERLFHHFFSAPSYPLWDYTRDLFFVHNYIGGRWGPTWSLDVEEAFYFLLVAYFFYCIKKKKLTLKTVIYTYAALLIWGIFWRWVAVIRHPVFKFSYHYIYTHFRLDALFFGVLLAYLYHFYRAELTAFIKKNKLVILSVSVIGILVNFIFDRASNTWISVALLATNPICYGLLLMTALQSSAWFLSSKFLAMVGRNSYAMYLWHLFINDYLHFFFFPNKTESGFLLYVVAYVATVIVAGIIITKTIEDPFLRLRDRLYPSKTKVPLLTNASNNDVAIPDYKTL